jgi:predicted nucleic acid-binding protein
MIVIADTSPINYLVRIEQIDLLPELFGQVFIPPSVRDELMDAGAPEPVRRWIADSPAWLRVHAPTQSADAALLTAALDAGEHDAIILAQELAADQIIIDDMDARREAERRHLTVTGTVGILRAAAALGLVDQKMRLFACDERIFTCRRNFSMNSPRRRTNERPSRWQQ